MSIKSPKFKQGDILSWTSFDKRFTETVKLLRRYDRRPSDRVAWMVRKSDGTGIEIAVPEDELTEISNKNQ